MSLIAEFVAPKFYDTSFAYLTATPEKSMSDNVKNTLNLRRAYVLGATIEGAEYHEAVEDAKTHYPIPQRPRIVRLRGGFDKCGFTGVLLDLCLSVRPNKDIVGYWVEAAFLSPTHTGEFWSVTDTKLTHDPRVLRAAADLIERPTEDDI